MLKIELEHLLPADIERRSMELIEQELAGTNMIDENKEVIKRVIHTTADFEYVDSLCFSNHAVQLGVEAIKNGGCIVTDTQMVKAGINKKVLAGFGGEVYCFMEDDDVLKAAKKEGTTRAVASMNKAANLKKPLIFAIGNAPTALVRIYELIEEKKILPELVIGVPVGFVNVIESKKLMLSRTNINSIISRGRKGGSNVAAAICNALLYKATGRTL